MATPQSPNARRSPARNTRSQWRPTGSRPERRATSKSSDSRTAGSSDRTRNRDPVASGDGATGACTGGGWPPVGQVPASEQAESAESYPSRAFLLRTKSRSLRLRFCAHPPLLGAGKGAPLAVFAWPNAVPTFEGAVERARLLEAQETSNFSDSELRATQVVDRDVAA